MPSCKKCKKTIDKDDMIEYSCHCFCRNCLKSNIKKGKAVCPVCEEEVNINFLHEVLDEDSFKKYFFGCKSCESYQFKEFSIDLSCGHIICKTCLKKIAFDKLQEDPRKINCIRKNCQENIKNDIELYYKICLKCEKVKRTKKLIDLSCSHSFCENCLSTTWNKCLKKGKAIKCLYKACKELQNPHDYDFLELVEENDNESNDAGKKQSIEYAGQSRLIEKSEIPIVTESNTDTTMDTKKKNSYEIIEKNNIEEEAKINPLPNEDNNLKKNKGEYIKGNPKEELDFSKFHLEMGTSSFTKANKQEEEEFKPINPEQNEVNKKFSCVFCKRFFIIDDLLILECEEHTSCKDCLDNNDNCNICKLCSVCSNYLPPANFLTLPCNHSFCKHCILTGWELLIKEAQATQSSMKCSQCSKPLEYFFLKEHLPKELFEKYDELINLEAILSMDNKNEKPVYCPQPNCSKLLLVDKKSNFVTCNFCSTKFCIDCKLLWEYHAGKKCEEVKKINIQMKESEKLLSNNSIKKCPNCNYLIEKTDCCNFVRCASPVCKKRFCFCFLCGSLLDQNNLKTHYLDGNQYQKCQGLNPKIPSPEPKKMVIKFKCNICKKEKNAKELLKSCKTHKTVNCMNCNENLLITRTEKHKCGEKKSYK